MQLIKTFLFLVCLIYLVFLCVANMQPVPLNIPFVAKLDSTPLFLIIILNIMIGVVIGGFLAALRNMKRYVKQAPKRQYAKELQRKVERLEQSEFN